MFPFTCWFYVRFYYNKLPRTSGGFEIASTIILLLQRKRQASWTSHIRVWKERNIWIIWMSYISFNSIKFFFPWSNHVFLYKKCHPVVSIFDYSNILISVPWSYLSGHLFQLNYSALFNNCWLVILLLLFVMLHYLA